MLAVFRIINGFDYIDREHFFVYSRPTLRGHNKQLFKPRCTLHIKKFTFSNHVIDPLNSLLQDVVDHCIANTKSRLGKHLLGRALI